MAPIRLAVLDVDGTLKQAESPYQFLHKRLGCSHLAAENRLLALSGQISYGEWLRRDVALWAGQPVAEVRRHLEENPFVPGAPELLRALKSRGVVVALVSAGFTLNTDPIVEEYKLDYVLANELIEENGLLTGAAINHVPEGGKGAFARSLVQRLGLCADETLAVGDTLVDLELFECAGVRVAVNPVSPKLAELADAVFEPDLRGAVDWLIARGHLASPESS